MSDANYERDAQGRMIVPMNDPNQPDPRNQPWGADPNAPQGPQPILDEHMYPTRPTTEPRMTHDAMTWQEELVMADELEAEDRELSELEVERIRVIRETAAAHEAIDKAEKEQRNVR